MKFIRQYPSCLVTAILFVALLIPVITSAQDTASKSSKAANKKVFYGQASFYANKFHGRKTATGEIFSQNKFTCACNVVRLGTWLKITNLRNGRSVIVRSNDRLHKKMKRVVDLSTAAAKKIGFTTGLARVKVEVLGRKKPVE